jgi:GntR family transcriptional regulator
MAEPKYRQIADDLRVQIDAAARLDPDEPSEPGTLRPGAQLPTETELIEDYSVSRNTIRDAIKMLTTLGLVETRAGQGTFVIEKPDPFMSTLTGDPRTGETNPYIGQVSETGRKYSQSDPTVEMQRATPDVADALGISEGAHVVSRHYQRFIDSTPWSLQTSFYPMSLVEKGAMGLIQPADIDEGAVEYIAQKCGIKQASYREVIAVRTPDETEIGFFKLPPDGRISVVETFRVAFAEEGRPIRLTITVYPADRNRFVINVGDVPSITPIVDNTEG